MTGTNLEPGHHHWGPMNLSRLQHLTLPGDLRYRPEATTLPYREHRACSSAPSLLSRQGYLQDSSYEVHRLIGPQAEVRLTARRETRSFGTAAALALETVRISSSIELWRSGHRRHGSVFQVR